MAQFKDYSRDPGYSRAIRMKIGDGLREQHDLTEPLPHSLLALLKRLETRVATQERLYAAVEAGVAAMAHLSRQTEEP
jgi:hypothetical protein